MTAAIEALAARTGFTIIEQAREADYLLLFSSPDNQLTLRNNTVTPAVDISIDFCTGRNRHRQQFGGGFGQALARAVNAGTLRNSERIICDATGGFGRDALVFASLGCQVVVLERSPVVFELLSDAINRALNDKQCAEVAARMHVYHADSTQLPANWPHPAPPHTIYLDPMYPSSGKSAAVKKDMQTLKHLLADDENSRKANDAGLLEAALSTATHRVVVKRPKGASPITGATPVGDIKSANTRYDIYHPDSN